MQKRIKRLDLEKIKEPIVLTGISSQVFKYLLDFCKKLQDFKDKNPSNDLGWTPLHAAAKNGHGEICKLIASNIVNKNPVSNDGLTPHQLWLSFGSVFK